ncbi:MAG: ASCH domain-containing protein [Anaerococcus sp.]|nr:ASCH domain-containing protein [Anaerococcus sp.]
MKALSMYAPYAMFIACKEKKIETRSWKTDYRGDILICSTVEDKNRKDLKDVLIFGHALAIAKIIDCQPFQEKDRYDACIDDDVDMSGMYSWFLTDIRPIHPVPIKGQQRIYNAPYELSDLKILDLEGEDLDQYRNDNGFVELEKVKEELEVDD